MRLSDDGEWRKAIAGYLKPETYEETKLLEDGTPDQVIAAFVNKISKRANATHWEWREEIAKYLPSIELMSFIGAKSTIRWLFEHVEIIPDEVLMERWLASEVVRKEKEKSNA